MEQLNNFPLPWYSEKDKTDNNIIRDANGAIVCKVPIDDNAELVLRAVNEYLYFEEAIEGLLQDMQYELGRSVNSHNIPKEYFDAISRLTEMSDRIKSYKYSPAIKRMI